MFLTAFWRQTENCLDTCVWDVQTLVQAVCLWVWFHNQHERMVYSSGKKSPPWLLPVIADCKRCLNYWCNEFSSCHDVFLCHGFPKEKKTKIKPQHTNTSPFQKHICRKKKKKNLILASSCTLDNLRINLTSPLLPLLPCILMKFSVFFCFPFTAQGSCISKKTQCCKF